MGFWRVSSKIGNSRGSMTSILGNPEKLRVNSIRKHILYLWILKGITFYFFGVPAANFGWIKKPPSTAKSVALPYPVPHTKETLQKPDIFLKIGGTPTPVSETCRLRDDFGSSIFRRLGAYTTLWDYRSPRTEKYVFPRDRALCYHETICI